MKDAKSLGINPEVAHLLLQPTPDQFYEINSSGRALLTKISVSAAPFSFSVYSTGLRGITAQHVLNLCYNNNILKANGDVTEMVEFLKRREGVKTVPFSSVRTMTRYFSFQNIPADAFVVPVADLGEGGQLSCVVIVASMPDAKNPEERIKFACLGFRDEYADKEIADKITQTGTEWLKDLTDRCVGSKLALVPWNTKLTEIQPAYLGD